MKNKKGLKLLILICTLLIMSMIIYVAYNIDFNQILINIEKLPVILKVIAMLILVILQIVLAFIPGEPIELASGYLFGEWMGTAICLVGSAIGTVLIYVLVRCFKNKIIDMMFNHDQVTKANQILTSQKNKFWMFIFFLLPGTPKDVLTYLVSLSEINLIHWVLITTVGRIPSIVTSTFLSASLKNGNLNAAFTILGMTVVLGGVGYIYYRFNIQKNMKFKK